MTVTSSRFRLRSSAFERIDDIKKIPPKRMIFLSVEGDETEKSYFNNLNQFLDNNIIKIEVLRHKQGDGYSAPDHVLELLEEYIDVREGNIIPKELIDQLLDKYTEEFIRKYIANDDSIDKNEKKLLEEDLLKIGIDIGYRKYLQEYRQEKDYFAVILDRDRGSHSKELMQDCIDKCRENNYGCFVSNPCFEFWLLLHLCDPKSEFSSKELEDFYSNPRVSKKHTKVSKEVSERAGHSKTISSTKFKEKYYPNIQQAMKNAERFATDFPDLLNNLGSNLPELIKIIGL